MEIVLKNVKFYEKLSEETNAFTADIFVNGKKLAYAKNEGHGGMTDIRVYDRALSPQMEELEAYCKTLPEKDYGTFKVKSDLEVVVDDLFEAWLTAKEQKKHDDKIVKNCEKGLCFGEREKYQIMTWKGHTIASLLKLPQGREILRKKVQEIKAQGKTLLNTNLPSEITQA